MTEANIPDPPSKPNPAAASVERAGRNYLAVRHFRIGWWLLLLFLTLGIVLEALHGFKSRWYLDVSNEKRRLMWTLAHAHGTLFGLLHVAFATTIAVCWRQATRRSTLAGRCLLASSLLVPGGFFLGGMFLHGSEPGYGILLVPAGALLLFAAVLLTTLSVTPAPGNKREE